jgi:pimeloyl-ACP methyl ester carboxylesterase
MSLTHHYARLSGVVTHYVTAGSGTPVLLLHGWPQSWWEWRHVIPALAERYRVIAPDLRGLGDSARPLEGCDFRTAAEDFRELLIDHLGIASAHVVGHDLGGPTAFALAAAHPALVRSLTVVDVTIPGIGPDVSQGGRRWHHAFHLTPDLPEALVQGRERIYLGWFYREFAWRRDAITDADIEEYLRTYTAPGALRAGFSYYRGLIRAKEQNRALLEAGVRLKMPVLAVGGARAESRGRGSEPAQSLRCVADDVTERVIADSGHFVPEEQPQALLAELLSFLARAD